MMMINQLNQEAFDIASKKLGYLKLFDHIFKDFVTRRDMLDMLVPNNLFVQVVVPPGGGSGTGGVISAIEHPGKGPTFGALALQQQKKLEAAVGAINPEDFTG